MSYYAIGIGGTGAKCLESLIHLVASGLLPPNEKLYILFVDPDKANGSLERANGLLEGYVECRKNIIVDSDFLRTPIEIAEPDVWTPLGEGTHQLREFALYDTLKIEAEEIAHLLDVLYSPEEKSTPLDKGFRGHPSIGAAVMASSVNLDTEEPWKTFWANIETDVNTRNKQVKVMLFGSIFGGTGASGFPTIARLLRNKFKEKFNPDKDKSADKKLLLSGVLMLPYFSFGNVEGAGMQANANDFLLNTQAALQYYYQQKDLNIFDSVYFVGSDDVIDTRVSAIGGKEQENEPHFTELYAALAAIEFFGGQSSSTDENRYHLTARAENKALQWTDLPMDTNILKKHILQMVRFSFAYLSVYQPMLQDIAKREQGFRAPWYMDFFKFLNIDVKARIELELEEIKKYCQNFLLWFANMEFSVSSSQNIVPNLLSFSSFAIVTKDAHEKDVVKLREPADFRLSEFERIVLPGMQKSIGLAELWERMCEARPKNSERNSWLFINELYQQCGKIR
jgi:hypothetical protein